VIDITKLLSRVWHHAWVHILHLCVTHLFLSKLYSEDNIAYKKFVRKSPVRPQIQKLPTDTGYLFDMDIVFKGWGDKYQYSYYYDLLKGTKCKYSSLRTMIKWTRDFGDTFITHHSTLHSWVNSPYSHTSPSDRKKKFQFLPWL